MSNQTIADLYAATDEVYENLKQLTSNLTDNQINALLDGEKWTIAQLVEHIAVVEEGMSKISAKLLSKARAHGGKSDGRAQISDNFREKSREMRALKLDAPEIVRPTGKLTVAESFEKMKENRRRLEEIRLLFESTECSDFKFPHPFMGELTAHEWLALIGGHGARHVDQLRALIGKTT